MARQNIYDDESFFEGYRRLRDEEGGLNAALEQPALLSVTPDLAGLRVVDLGCGDGGGCLRAALAGASSVVGVEPSRRMLALAGQRASHPAISYLHAFVEDVDLEPGSVDVVLSSLALHYVEDLDLLFRRVADWLRPGGALVFSIEHPVVTASPAGRRDDGWLLTGYGREGVRNTRWFVEGVLKYHRTVSAIASGVLGAGLRVEALLEPIPTAEDLAARPDLAIHCERPALLVMRCTKST